MTQDPSLHLVLAGRAGDGLAMPSGERVHYLGELAYDKIPLFWNALDVAVICIRETEFGRYSFPQKAYEILACKTPLIAAAVGSMKALLAAEPHCLYTPDDSDDLFHKLKAQLNTPHYPAIDVPTWQQQAARLDSAIQAAL
jgi:glycosyltransferase involved in cell wall biosynthesis